MLTSANALEIFKDYDIIADGTDNFQTRYLVNDACVLLGKPNAYGSIFRFEGQASVFATEDGPCYRCLYPEPPPPGLVPSCAEGGVLGILPGLVGVIQATEVIKLILGIGDTLAGRLLLVDALGMNFRTLKLRKNPDCPMCGTHEIKQLIDYDQFCGIEKPNPSARSKSPATKPSAKPHRRWHPADHRRGTEEEDRRQGGLLPARRARAARSSPSPASARRSSPLANSRNASESWPRARARRSSSTAAPAPAARKPR